MFAVCDSPLCGGGWLLGKLANNAFAVCAAHSKSFRMVLKNRRRVDLKDPKRLPQLKLEKSKEKQKEIESNLSVAQIEIESSILQLASSDGW